MCTRYYIEPDIEEIREIIAEIDKRNRLARRFVHDGNAIVTSGEIRPTNVVPVIAPNREGRQSVYPMKWGFQIPGRSLLVNARVETASAKPTFQESWAKRRCVIPASWYYEWEHRVSNTGRKTTGDKYLIQPRDSEVTWLCGLYRMEGGMPSFAILTREPVGELAKIHDRMPLILPKELIADWISPGSDPEKLIRHALVDMICEKTG